MARDLNLLVIFIIVAISFLGVQRTFAQERPYYYDSIMLDEDAGQIFMPSFVYAEPVMDEIYVIDNRMRILVYTKDLFPFLVFRGIEGLYDPQGLVLDDEGYVYVAQGRFGGKKQRISVFNPAFQWERDIFLTEYEGLEGFIPYRLAIDKNGYIYIAGIYDPIVPVIDRAGNLIDTIIPDEDGEKVIINNIALDSKGRIYLLSEEAGRILVYDENRKNLFNFGEKGGSTGKLSRPKGIVVNSEDGYIYVSDYMRHSVNVYDMYGKFLYEFGGLGWSPGWFAYPQHLAIDKRGRLYVCDTFNNRVQVFNTR